MIPSSSYDRVKTYLKRVIDTVTKRMDFMALYPCKVVSQNGDNTLELTPDNPALPSHSRVPLRLGIPGATAKVQAGSRVLLGFEGGDPRAPIATLWGTSTVTELDIGNNPTDYMALASLVKNELTRIQTHFAAVEAVITGVPIPEPGSGAPSAFQTALKAAITSSAYPSPNDVKSATVKST